MSDTIIDWILNSWDEAKKEYEEKKEIKSLKLLAETLRLFINEVRTKYGVPQHHKEKGEEMAAFISREFLGSGAGLNELQERGRSVGHGIIVDLQYARKHLGSGALQGSAIKNKLTKADRARFRKLAKSAKPAARSSQPELPKNPHHADELQSGSVGDGNAETT
jgi:hypothetical protein